MEYATAVEQAPPGWRHFSWADTRRLSGAVLRHELAWIPSHERELADGGDEAAVERVMRALFWTLVYQLEAERWDELSRIEPIHPRLLEALPRQGGLTLDIGAGSGRLTRHLIAPDRTVIAIEPSRDLGSILVRRLPAAGVVAAWAEKLPLPDRCAQLTAACGALGPDPVVLTELERVTMRGGTIALISPEQPEWFEGQGWTRLAFDPLPAAPHAGWIDEFFGPPDPPHELVVLTVE